MLKLLLSVTLQERVLQQCVFDARTLTIGRFVENDIVLDHPTVSRVHAEISYESGRFFLNDLGSANKTLLNGKAVSRQKLCTGDVIAVGTFRVHIIMREDAGVKSVVATLHGRGKTLRVRE